MYICVSNSLSELVFHGSITGECLGGVLRNLGHTFISFYLFYVHLSLCGWLVFLVGY